MAIGNWLKAQTQTWHWVSYLHPIQPMKLDDDSIIWWWWRWWWWWWWWWWWICYSNCHDWLSLLRLWDLHHWRDWRGTPHSHVQNPGIECTETMPTIMMTNEWNCLWLTKCDNESELPLNLTKPKSQFLFFWLNDFVWNKPTSFFIAGHVTSQWGLESNSARKL